MTAYTVGAVPGVVPRPFEAPQPVEAPAPPDWSSTIPGAPPVAEDALRQQAAALLQHVYRWLEATAPVAPQLLGVVPMLITAVQLYEVQQYPACLQQVRAATGVLQRARWSFPALPPL